MSVLQLEMKFADFSGKLEKVIKEVSKIDVLVTEVKQCREGMEYMNAQFESMKKELSVVTDNHKVLWEDHKDLKVQIADLKRELDRVKMNNDVKDKENQVFGVELSLVPEAKEENLLEVVSKIASAVDVSLQKETVSSIYRKKIKGVDKVGDIVAVFDTKENRNKFLLAIKKKKPRASDVGFVKEKSPIYVKELLTVYGKELYFKALIFKKENNWKFLWISDGKVLIREREGERYHIIRNLEDIKKLKG